MAYRGPMVGLSIGAVGHGPHQYKGAPYPIDTGPLVRLVLYWLVALFLRPIGEDNNCDKDDQIK